MKTLINKQGALKGTIEVPGDKSISHRSIMLGAISKGETNVYNFLQSEDSFRTIKAFQEMDVQIEKKDHAIRILGKGVQHFTPPKNELDMGNSGTTVRLLSGILSTLPFESKLVGDDSLSRRPMNRVIDPLADMGALIDSSNGTLPMNIKGKKLNPITYKLPVDSAQVKSAILFAGLLTEGNTTVIEPNITRDHTERMLPIFGASIQRKGNNITIEGLQDLKGSNVYVPGDISSASFWLAGATITPGSEVTIQNVGLNPTRTGFIDVLKRMGANIETEITSYEGDEPIGHIHVRYTESLVPIKIDEHEIAKFIDEVPLLALVATQVNGSMTINHIEELRHKESDRINTTVNTLKSFGAKIKEINDGIVVEGGHPLNGADIKAFGDHRIAMMAAIASLITRTPVTIKDSDCIKVSYPNFFDDLTSILK
ncbi:3-phosphoshikimate 1-carboxyvinyltransferase [Piscibacillus sp. B03]|uniref:3-phosphoshikimate 1-carboxyvinyltransferase n=1 Tax=Piscibacillus sp. B03 TaxID=3457430 RepID=UPI003FCD4ABC